MIHSTAVIHSKARVHPSVEIGPCAVIDGGAIIGAECWIGPHVHITGETEIGERNRFHAGCVIGDAPQDLKYQGDPTRLRIGDDNVFREHVTIHRSNSLEEDTVIGTNCFFMAGSHVGHNCQIGNHVIIANGALLGGHVQVHDRAFISGTCMLHQFVRVGTLALMQGGTGISKDLPPFTIAHGNNGISGLNTVGLRRAGYDNSVRLELRRLYHALFCGNELWQERLSRAEHEFGSEASRVMLDFVRSARRGLCRDVSRRSRSEPESAG